MTNQPTVSHLSNSLSVRLAVQKRSPRVMKIYLSDDGNLIEQWNVLQPAFHLETQGSISLFSIVRRHTKQSLR